MKLPILYKKAATGGLQQWMIWTEGNVICTRYGKVGGAQQETRDVIARGKNVGRSNETTPTQQAEAEACAKWETKKKGKHGYVESQEAAESGGVDALIEGGVNVMLAHTYDKQGHKIKWPAFAQPKLDGHRCVVVIDEDGKASLWSRTRKRITGVPHIARAFEKMGLCNEAVDGELYSHDYRDRFEELTSFIKQETPKPGYEVVQFHAYDLASHGGPFCERITTLKRSVKANGVIKLVETRSVEDEAALMEAFEEFTAQGYEGAMARNAAGLYVGRRSYDLLKVKAMEDAEFKIVGVKEGRGRMAGLAIFTCETRNGAHFDVKMKGALENLRCYWQNPKLAVGRLLTVRYQNLTADRIPRFPVGLRLKEVV